MTSKGVAVAAAFVLVAAASPLRAQDATGAEAVCVQGERAGLYACTLTLKGRDAARPIQGAAVFAGSDVPGRDIKPVKAEATGKTGEYRFTVELEAEGEWSLKVRLAKPRQDLIVHRMVLRKPGN